MSLCPRCGVFDAATHLPAMHLDDCPFGRPFQVGDVVTIGDGRTRFDITQVDGDLARVWPADEQDQRDGQWVGTGLLRRVDTTTTPTRPRLLSTNFELLRVLEGHELVFRCDDGTEVVVRLYTADELLAANAAVRVGVPPEQLPAPMTREQAENLTQPLNRGGA